MGSSHLTKFQLKITLPFRKVAHKYLISPFEGGTQLLSQPSLKEDMEAITVYHPPRCLGREFKKKKKKAMLLITKQPY